MLFDPLTQDLYIELGRLPIIDAHTHLDPHQPTARNLDDLLGYHFYPELAHATGMERALLAPNVDPRDRVRALFYHLADFFPNTVQHQWLVEIAHAFLGFEKDRLTFADCTRLYDAAAERMARPDWEQEVLRLANIEKVFVESPFDEPLDGFDTARYVPCLRADELVFHIDRSLVRQRLAEVSGVEAVDAERVGRALAARCEHFRRHQARAITLRLPPHFMPGPVAGQELTQALSALVRAGAERGKASPAERQLVARGVLRAVVEQCATFHLPLHLMLGVSHRVSQRGGYQQPELYDRRASLLPYLELFQSFPTVTFCLSVLPHGQEQELIRLARILPNVVTCGHGGDTNTIPVALEETLRLRLQAVPQVKQIGYFTNLDRLEFCLPQFNMYRRVLAQVLADDFVRPRLYTIWQALQVGRLLLRDNARRIFDV
jgi:glucuronate isomerase